MALPADIFNLSEERTVPGFVEVRQLTISNASTIPAKVTFTPLGSLPPEPFFIVVPGLDTIITDFWIYFDQGFSVSQLSSEVQVFFTRRDHL